MTRIKDIFNYLDSKFPVKKSEEWDTSGLLFGSKTKKVNKIIVALDVTKEIFDKAVLDQVDLIITHHPIKFFETLEEEFQKAPYKEELFDRINNTGIGIMNFHTCYDNAKDGTWLQVAKALGVPKPTRVTNSEYALKWHDSKNIGQVEQLLFNKLEITKVSTNVKLDSLLFKTIALIPGSGSIEDIIKSKNDGADLVITSDIKWSDQITINELDINVLHVSHNIENVFVHHVHKLLSTKFKKVQVDKIIINEIL